MQAFGRNGYGPKTGGAVPLWGGQLGLHLTQCGQGRGLPACQVTSWSIKPFGHNPTTLQADRTDRQQSDSIGRTVLQMVAQKHTLLPTHLFHSEWPALFAVSHLHEIILSICTDKHAAALLPHKENESLKVTKITT